MRIAAIALAALLASETMLCGTFALADETPDAGPAAHCRGHGRRT